MTITRHDVRSLLSMAVVRGDTVYLAGHIAESGDGVAEQTEDILGR